MKIKTIFRAYALSAVLLGLATCSFGQNVGYCGKKFSLNYYSSFSSALSNPNVNHQSGITSFNFAHNLVPEFTISPSASLCVRAGFFKTAFEYKTSFNYDGTGVYSNEIFEFDPHNLYGDLSVQTLGIGFKFFRRNFIAPLGKYFKPEFFILAYSVNEPSDTKVLESCNWDGLQNMNAPQLPQFKNRSPYLMAGLGFEVGASRILFDKLIFNYGIGVAFFPNSFFYTLDNSVAESMYYYVIPKARLNGLSLINARIGIGGLLF
ncbi:MAG: hypothetical protein V2A54_05495 [Bacteroidota bacterium]